MDIAAESDVERWSRHTRWGDRCLSPSAAAQIDHSARRCLMDMELTQALWALEEGYCLWVGAGLTRQVAAGYAAVPLWDQITLELESTAGIQSGENKDFPSRLDRCLTVLGENEFRKFLRERYYTHLCVALLSQTIRSLGGEDYVPDNA